MCAVSVLFTVYIKNVVCDICAEYILKPYGSNYYHSEWKEKLLIWHNKWASRTFVIPVGECVCTNPDMFMPQTTDCISDILLGSLIFPRVDKDYVFDNLSKFLGGKRLALMPWDQGAKLQAYWSLLLDQSPNECFACFPLLAQKTLLHSINLNDLKDPAPL